MNKKWTVIYLLPVRDCYLYTHVFRLHVYMMGLFVLLRSFHRSKRLFHTLRVTCGQLYIKREGLLTWYSRMELEIHPWSCVCCLMPHHTYYFGCRGSGNVPANDWSFSTWSNGVSKCCVPPCWGSRRTGSPETPKSNKQTKHSHYSSIHTNFVQGKSFFAHRTKRY